MLNQTGSAPVTSFAGVGYRIDVIEAFGSGLTIEAGGGYDFGSIRAEITYVRNNMTMDSGQGTLVQRTIAAPLSTKLISPYSNTNSAMLSAYYDVNINSKITPYIGGGIGVTQINWGGISSNGFAYNLYQSPGRDTSLGYQAKIGASYQIKKNLDAYIEGTYQGASTFSIGTFTSNSPNQSGINFDSLNQFGARAGIRIRL